MLFVDNPAVVGVLQGVRPVLKITSTAISVLFSMMIAMIFAGCDSGHTGFSDSESSVSPEMPSVGDSVSVQADPKPAPPAVRKFYSAEEAKE